MPETEMMRGKVYEFLLYDRPELFWCDGSTRMTIYEDYTEVVPGYTCTKAEKEQRQARIRLKTGPRRNNRHAGPY